jgi:hypothetical protein
MVVGPTGGGKSSNIKVLCSALSKLKADGVVGERYEKAKIFHLNPKSIRMGQLYGEFDENTVHSPPYPSPTSTLLYAKTCSRCFVLPLIFFF